MAENILVGGAGVALSLLFAYVGGFREWYEAQAPVRKGQVMLGLTLLVAAAVAVGSCYLNYTWMTCDEGGFKELARLFAWAIGANQVTYMTITKAKARQA